MNIQIFGASKSFDTKKAQRWFKERRIPFQYIDLPSKGLSPREYQSIRRKIPLEALIDEKSKKHFRVVFFMFFGINPPCFIVQTSQ